MNNHKRFFLVTLLVFILLITCTTTKDKFSGFALFNDNNLENAIRKIINKPKGDILISDLNNIKRLDIKGNDIQKLSGIENFKKLEFLNIAGNPINDMSILSKLPKLEALIIGYADPGTNKPYVNELIDLTTLADLTKLKILHLAYYNGIKKIENPDISVLSNLKNLTSLVLVWNNIEDISPISKLKNLKSLVLSSNKIKDLTPLAGLTRLIRLSLDGNNITDISPLSNLSNLRALYLSWNQISNIDALSNLKEIGDITHIEKNLNDEIEVTWIKTDESLLWLSNNNINDITPLLENYNNGGLRKLSAIYINNNNIDLTPDSENSKVVEILTQAGIEFR